MSVSQLWTIMYYAGYMTQVQGSFSQGSSNNNPDSDADGEDNTAADGGDNTAADGEGDTDSRTDTYEDGSIITKVEVRIPNYEIRSVFRRWLRIHLNESMKKAGLTRSSVELFDAMVQGPLSQVALRLRRIVRELMPRQLLGNKEIAYHSYLCVLVTAASDYHPKVWTVDPESYGGIGRLDLLIYSSGDYRAVIQEFKSIKLSKKDKEETYGDDQSERLTNKAKSALDQIEVKHYRNAIPEHVTVLHEYGVAFLGVCCAVVGQSLSREKEGQWKITEVYSSHDDEMDRKQFYARPS